MSQVLCAWQKCPLVLTEYKALGDKQFMYCFQGPVQFRHVFKAWMPLKSLIEIFIKGLNWIVHRYEHTPHIGSGWN